MLWWWSVAIELLFVGVVLMFVCVCCCVLCLLLHQVQLQKLSMEQEISLVEMTEQIIGKEAECYTVWSWSHLCLVSRLSDFFSAFVVVVFFVCCCRCV